MVRKAVSNILNIFLGFAVLCEMFPRFVAICGTLLIVFWKGLESPDSSCSPNTAS